MRELSWAAGEPAQSAGYYKKDDTVGSRADKQIRSDWACERGADPVPSTGHIGLDPLANKILRQNCRADSRATVIDTTAFLTLDSVQASLPRAWQVQGDQAWGVGKW